MGNRPDLSTDVAVLVPAAGSGSRLGGVPKQFRKLGNRPLLHRTLETMCAVPEVALVVVAVPPESVDEVTAAIEPAGLHAVIVPGGTTRQDSVRRCLERVPPAVEVVLVHDAARPFIAVDDVQSVIAGVRGHGAAALAIPVSDTLRKVVGENFGQTLPREGIYRMQTPQGFRADMFLEAHRWARDTGWLGTDDVDLVRARGHEVHVIHGRSTNFKITTADDWRLAERVWPNWVGSRSVGE